MHKHRITLLSLNTGKPQVIRSIRLVVAFSIQPCAAMAATTDEKAIGSTD
jgi:hypothetical protein